MEISLDAYLDAMRRYGSFAGRATRSQFWLYTLVLLLMLIAAMLIDISLGADIEHGPFIVAGIVNLAHLVPTVAVFVRRLHDIDRSGWWILPCLIPGIGIIPWLVFACTASTPEANRFGQPVDGGDAGNRHLPASPAPRPSVTATADIDKLERLAALKAAGAIDEAEFLKMKADLLSGKGA